MSRAPCERTRFRANARTLTKAGTIFESRHKSEPFHVHNDVGSRHPFAAKRPILAGLNCGINDGSSFCGAQASRDYLTGVLEHRRAMASAPEAADIDSELLKRLWALGYVK